jgi:lipoprotein-anchoring transpeptidase ErfK/SrfK
MQHTLNILLALLLSGALALVPGGPPSKAAHFTEGQPLSASSARLLLPLQAQGDALFPHEEHVPGSVADVQPKSGSDLETLQEETYSDITSRTVNREPRLPVSKGSGPSVAHVQILLDRVDFSPGILDGHWGMNTEKAVYWFQAEHGLERTGVIDRATYRRLHEAAGEPATVTRHYTLTEEDLEGPFFPLPANVYERAKLARLVYESPLEMLSERFHVHPKLLRQLNPEIDFAALRAGTRLEVPHVTVVSQDPHAPELVARIRISKDGLYLHAKDADDRILFHFPVTIGVAYDPQRFARQRVTAVVYEPDFRYQPQLHAKKPGPDAILPPGPNSPVGLIWIALEASGYGIHGTPSPRTIGYEKSLGCVRLTNWDAILLANHTATGTPVEFH